MKTSELLATAADRIEARAESDEDNMLVEDLRIRSAEIVAEPPSAALVALELGPAKCSKCGKFLTGIRAEMRLPRCAKCER